MIQLFKESQRDFNYLLKMIFFRKKTTFGEVILDCDGFWFLYNFSLYTFIWHEQYQLQLSIDNTPYKWYRRYKYSRSLMSGCVKYTIFYFC